jgi:hypothetical protein
MSASNGAMLMKITICDTKQIRYKPLFEFRCNGSKIKAIYIYLLCRQMYTLLCYLTQFLLLNVAQHVSSLYTAHLQGLFR